jgi:hypothetical protein
MKSKATFSASFSLACVLGMMTLSSGVVCAQAVRLDPPAEPIPRTLFGLHIHHLVLGSSAPTSWPSIPFGTWRLWDAYVVWANLEPHKGKWDFATLDKYVSMAQEHGVQILMPLGMPPSWASERPKEAPAFRPGSAAPPKNMSEWDNYIRTLATRYKGRIRYWELWNEPNLKGFYTGRIPHMVELAKTAYTILKQIDPRNELVSPAATAGYADNPGPAWLGRYLKAGGERYADIIGYHMYVSPKGPEAMVPLIQKLKRIMSQSGVGDKPLWDTETGWYIQDSAGNVRSPNSAWPVLSAQEAEGYVARAYILAWASGVSRLYWYDWDSDTLGLAEPGFKFRKPAAYAYWITEKWLVGSRMTSCGSDPSGTWVCHITRSGGYSGYIVWNASRNKNFGVPNSWGVRDVWHLYGKTDALPKTGTMGIGAIPVLLENRQP